jgi:hypothetical protein
LGVPIASTGMATKTKKRRVLNGWCFPGQLPRCVHSTSLTWNDVCMLVDHPPAGREQPRICTSYGDLARAVANVQLPHVGSVLGRERAGAARPKVARMSFAAAM